MECKDFNYPGIGECDRLMGNVIGFGLFNKKTTLSDVTALATYQTIIADDGGITGMYIPITRGFVNNTAEPTMDTTTNNTEKVDDPQLMYVGYFDGSYTDYKLLYPADHKDFDVVFFLDDGTVWYTENSSGTDVGMRVGFNIRKNGPVVDNKKQMFPIYINFKYMDDLDNAKLSRLAFPIKELVDSIPVGLTASVSTAYSAGDVVIKVLKRGTSTPFADLTAIGDVTITSQVDGSSDLDVAVTAIDTTSASVGEYTLTIKKDSSGTPADLTSGVYIQVHDDDGTNYTYISNNLLISV